jgi:hypothetical protein
MSVYLNRNATVLFLKGKEMSDFDKREKSEEAKYALKQELRFKAMARRNKLLGLWAAELMSLSKEEAQNYALEVIKADFEEVGDEDVFRKIRADFDANNIQQSDHQIRRTMEELLTTAMEQIENET